MAEKAGKIENIDAKRNACNYNGPATSINMKPAAPRREGSSNARGQGGIH